MPKIVTANRLSTGTVVFLGQGDQWVETVDGAQLFDDAASAEGGLAIGQRDVERAIVVDPFVTDKGAPANGKPGTTAMGMTLRDSIRASGPTIDYLAVPTRTA